MKVLQIVSTCSKAAGVARVLMNYFGKIKEKVTFDFLIFQKLDRDSFEEEIAQYGGKVIHLPKPGIRSIWQYRKDFLTIVREGQYDLVELNEIALSPFVMPVLKKNGIKSIVHAHTIKFSEYPLRNVRNAILAKWSNVYADYFFACSRLSGEKIFGKHITKKQKFFVINNAIKLSDFSFSTDDRARIRKEFGLNDEKVILHVGRMSPAKNQGFLVDVFDIIAKKDPSCRLLFVGDGPDMTATKQKVEMLGLSQYVLFAGVRSDIGALMSAGDVFAFPSRFEGLGITLIEAQTNGLPCVSSTSIPKEAHVLDNYHSVSLGEIDRWASTIMDAVGHRINDPEGQIKRAGFDMDTEAQKLADLYEKLAK